ncbi:metallophosphatase family protein [archaeon]|nr:metallophosphatase family protein [archaeon]
MKVAVIADIHANLPAFESVLEEIGDLPKFCCGDLVGYNPFPNEVIEIVKEQKIVSILGNHDNAVITGDTSWFNRTARKAIDWTRGELTTENFKFLKSLPRSYDNEIYMAHGSPKDLLEEYVYPEDPAYVFGDFFNYTKNNIIAMGHTHVPFKKIVDEKLIFNPGSVGQPRDGDSRASYGILDTNAREVEIKRVKYDIERTAKKIEAVGLPGRLAMRLFSGV